MRWEDMAGVPLPFSSGVPAALTLLRGAWFANAAMLAGDASRQRHVLHQYSPQFLDQMINVVTASTVVCYALYAVSPETLEKYNTEDLIFTLPMVLFGIFRYLFLIYQTTHKRNPTESMLADVPFLLNLLIWGAAVTWIVYGR